MPKRRKRVDPRADVRRATFLSAAAQTFLEKGYDGTSLDDVITRSGGSRATLYAQFGSKEGLFAAIIQDLCDGVVAHLKAPDARQGIRDALRVFGRAYMRMLMTQESLALYRLVMAEGVRFPVLAKAVYRSGPLAAADRLAMFLRTRIAAGDLRVSMPALTARHFLEMVKGDLHFRAVVGIGTPSAAEVRRCVDVAVDIFLAGAEA